MSRIDKYLEFTTKEELDYIKQLAARLAGVRANVVINKLGTGGIESMRQGLLPLVEDLGIKVSLVELNMPDDFITAVNRFYKAVHDPFFQISDEDLKVYESYSSYIARASLKEGDLCFVEDIHPLSLVKYKSMFKKMAWRAHLDFSNGNKKLISFLKPYMEAYDLCLFSMPTFFPKITAPMRSLMPSIDPLSDKNKPLTKDEVDAVYKKYKIPRNKKIILQLGRFDAIKDPLGVLDVFAEVKKEFDVALVLAGYEIDKSEDAAETHRQTLDKAAEMKDVYVLMLEHNDIEINALQRGADIVLQKSIKEGFGLSVTEALWKERAVVASDVGGLPMQVVDGVTGLLCNSKQGCATQLKKLLRTPAYGAELGRAGRQNVKDNFLTTRHVRDILQLFNMLMDDKK